MPTYHVENFGCRATQADGAALERQFEARGLSRADAPSEAKVVVLNTCTVTAAADQDARAAIRRIQRKNPKARIIVTGCYAQRAPEEIAALPGVSLVIGNSHKSQLAELALSNFHELQQDFGRRCDSSAATESMATELLEETGALAAAGHLVPLSALTDNWQPGRDRSIFVSDIFAHTELLAAPVFEGTLNSRTRPNLKIQDGCDNRCSFCVIPYVRGQSRSLRPAEIIREVNLLVDSGYREVVISGINLGRWGRDLAISSQPSAFSDEDAPQQSSPDSQHQDGQRFESLIRAILEETSLEKLRISSVEPMDWSDELIALVAESPRIAKHAHVPLQSGSDAVLRRMHRKYRPWHYREKIEKIRAALPTAAIGADVMAGFPGETDAEFEATRHLIEELPFTYLHVFTYSARPGTPAADMRNQVPVHIARERNRILRDLAAEKKQAFMQSFVGQTLPAITLGSGEETSGECNNEIPAFTEALTDNFLKLNFKGSHVANRWLNARILAVDQDVLIGVEN